MDEVDAGLLAACDLALDAGPVSGEASTVVDLSLYDETAAGVSCVAGPSTSKASPRCWPDDGEEELLRTLRFFQVDVFTDRPFAGNPLAVFPEAEGLSAAQMQAIAREMNLSETTFVLPAEGDGDARVRIFTPGLELPFAGHPSVGTACTLVRLGLVDVEPVTRVVLELGVARRRRSRGARRRRSRRPCIRAAGVHADSP